eukprot:3478460-Prymnesium_polylepis.3
MWAVPVVRRRSCRIPVQKTVLKPFTARTRPPPTPYPSTRISGGVKSPPRASLVDAGVVERPSLALTLTPS